MSYNIDIQSAVGTAIIPGSQPTTFVTLPIDPTPVVEGSIYYNVSVGMFVMGSRIDGTPTWVPLPTSFSPSPNTGRSIDSSMSPVTIFPTDYILSVDSSGGAITLYLPDVANVAPWKQYVIKDAGGLAATNHIIISSEPHTIDGAASLTLDTNYQSTTVYTDGSQWYVF